MNILKPLCLSTILLLSACATKEKTSKPMGMPDSLPQNWRQDAKASTAPPIIQRRTDMAGRAYSNNAQETSLWNSSPKSLFGDRRASRAGDILTVVIEIDDEAEIQNSVSQSRQADQGFGVGALFGLPEIINQSLPDGASLTPAIDVTRNRQSNGSGNIRRGEKITLRLAAQVSDVMPNGYLKVGGRQEIMVNNEVRYLQVTGLIRTQDISRLNTITYDKIADARIYYGGQGNITDTVKPQKGQKILNRLLPF